MKRFIKAAPADDKKFLKKWHANQDDLDWSAADLYRFFFNGWKRKEKRSAVPGKGIAEETSLKMEAAQKRKIELDDIPTGLY
jgi:hypothetical protein